MKGENKKIIKVILNKLSYICGLNNLQHVENTINQNFNVSIVFFGYCAHFNSLYLEIDTSNQQFSLSSAL